MFFSLFLCLLSFANAESLLFDPKMTEESLYIAPVVYNHSLEGPTGPSSKNAHWFVAQWNNPSNIIPSARTGSMGPCSMSNPDFYLQTSDSSSAHVCSYSSSGSRTWELFQNGSQVPCGKEFDLFMSPVSNRTYDRGSYPSGMRASAPLGSLSSLNVSLSVSLPLATLENRCGSGTECGPGGKIDYSYVVLGVVLDNFVSKETIFYQTVFYDSRDQTPACNVDECKPRDQGWYFTSNPYGVNDAIATLGFNCLTPPQTTLQSFNLQLLPRFLLALRTGPSGLDPNPSNWQATSIYFGLGLQGSATARILLKDFDITQKI